MGFKFLDRIHKYLDFLPLPPYLLIKNSIRRQECEKMLKTLDWTPHHQFQTNLINNLKTLLPYYKERILFLSTVIDKVFYLDLDKVRPILTPFYSSTGRPAKYQPEILRSIVVMTHLDIHSITKWVKLLGSDLVDIILEGRPIPYGPEKVLNKIFAELVVKPSAEKQFLGDVNDLTISGDSAPVKSGGNPYGKKVCNCSKNSIKNCNCKRRFSDPSARLGWDSYHQRYFFGYSLYTITATSSPYDLPIYFVLAQGNRHDSATSVVALSQAK